MLDCAETEFVFGPLRLIRSRRALYDGDVSVTIHGRAFDLLAVLLEHRDRVVGRDELLALVWAGSTVSDGNIAVQVAALRRLLSIHGVDGRAIANVPGRGYQFVGEVSVRPASAGRERVATARSTPAHAPQPEPPVPAEAGARAGRRLDQRRSLALVTLAAVLLVITAVVTSRSRGPPSPAHDPRLTIGLRPLTGIGPPPAGVLAGVYTNALRTRPRRYGDIRIFEAEEAADARWFHFVFAGSIQVIGTTALLSYTVLRPDGEVIIGGTDAVPFAPSGRDLSSEASAILRRIKSPIFEAEAAARVGPPRDAIDFLIQAQVQCREDDTPEHLTAAIGSVEQALARDPASFPARLLLAALLSGRLVLSPAQDGDGDGRRALTLVDALLAEDPDNVVSIEIKAITLLALNDAALAVPLIARGLALDPTDPVLRSTSLDADEEAGDFQAADALAGTGEFPPDDSGLAELRFAEGDDPATIIDVDQYLSVETVDVERRLVMLLKAASLVRLRRATEGTAVIRDAIAGLPPSFRTRHGLRRAFYQLPPPAWAAFTLALSRGGMSP